MLHTIFSLAVALQTVSSSSEWAYDNQAHWGKAFAFCGQSSPQQSPIAINVNTILSCASNNLLDWHLNGEISSFTVSHSDHYNIKVKPHPPANKPILTSTLGQLKNDFVTPTGEHKQYCLDSVHFHWRSEHTINDADSSQKALEAHFVHYSCDYKNLQEALKASPKDTYRLAVVAVLFDIGKENKFLKAITDKVKSITKAISSPVTVSGQDVQMHDLFNVEIEHPAHFYYYKGSLTTPPCTPIVSWHILKKRMQLSEDQFKALSNTLMDEKNQVIKANYRSTKVAATPVSLCPGDQVQRVKTFDWKKHITNPGDSNEKESS